MAKETGRSISAESRCIQSISLSAESIASPPDRPPRRRPRARRRPCRARRALGRCRRARLPRRRCRERARRRGPCGPWCARSRSRAPRPGCLPSRSRPSLRCLRRSPARCARRARPSRRCARRRGAHGSRRRRERARSSASRYSGKVSQSQSMPSESAAPGMSSTPSISSISISCWSGCAGAKPTPQLPTTAVVTPCQPEGSRCGSQVACAS